MGTIVEIRDLQKCYSTGGGPVQALGGVSLEVEAGRFIAIMGASGSGKSTLLHLTGGLDLPDVGSITIEGRDITRLSDHQRTVFRRRRLGVVFQAYNLLPTLTARENIALPLLVDRVANRKIREKTEQMLQLLDLAHRADHRPDAMSGGEQQRVAIARALMNDPAVILADEPTGNLDSTMALKIWQLLNRLAREQGTTVMMVTHEAAGAAYADRVHVLRDGRFVGTIEAGGGGETERVATEYLRLSAETT
jgi:putative ABC transport system ATP-binding protein